jgi:prepilin signal peptidase PulO-like enzyme (type II secretory pathway)
MSKQPQKKQAAQQSAKPNNPLQKTKSTAAKKTTDTSSLFDILENHFSKKSTTYLIVLIALSAVFSILCFDNKISTANDDALYIEAGASYAKDFFGYFYTANAPFYPMLLGMVIKLAGVKLFLLKLLSVVFFAFAIYFVYKAYEKRIPYIILIPSMLLTAVNFQFLMYASLTYTETFSLMVFGICFWILFRQFDKFDAADYSFTKNIPSFILIGFLFFWMMLTRNVALAAIGILAVFFIYRKQYKEAAASVAGFGLFYAVYKLALKYIWKLDGSQFVAQSKLMFQKDAYQPQLGSETFSGFIQRFIENCQIYISSRFYFVLGFREEMSPNIAPLTVISIGIIVWSLVLMHQKKQHILIFTTLFFGGLLATTFISLHTSWGQTRLIMLFLPFILFAVFYLLYTYGKQFSYLQMLYPLFFFILFFKSFSTTVTEAKNRFPVFVENMTGDPTYGYTPDWQNYIKMTKWCAQNLPDEKIAVRKAPMSFVFSEGKEFHPIYNTPTENPDSLLMPLRAGKVNYIMLPKLRLDPNRYLEGQFIGTMHRYVYYIQQKYPNAFEFVHQEGTLEEAQLYKIRYPYIDSILRAQTTAE